MWVKWIDTILEHGVAWVCGCVGKNIDKEAKFDLMTGQGRKKISLEAQGLC